MGGKVPKAALDKFGEHELLDLRRTFKSLAKKKKSIDKETFVAHFMKSDPDLGARLFDAFDEDGNGALDQKEFILGLAMSSRGLRTEKMKFLFKVFDTNKDGTIAKPEMEKLLSSVFFSTSVLVSETSKHTDTHAELASSAEDMLGRWLSKKTSEDVHKLVEEAFQMCDVNHDNQLTLDEFVRWASDSAQVRVLTKALDEFDVMRADGHTITGPTDVQHLSHIGFTEKGFEIANIPEAWVSLFKKAGIKPSELRNPETAKLVVGVVAQALTAPPPPPLPAAGAAAPVEVAEPIATASTVTTTNAPKAPPAPPVGPPPAPVAPAKGAPPPPPAPRLASLAKENPSSFLDQIKGNTFSLKKMEKEPPPNIEGLVAEDLDDLASLLKKAMDSRRSSIDIKETEEEDDNDEWL